MKITVLRVVIGAGLIATLPRAVSLAAAENVMNPPVASAGVPTVAGFGLGSRLDYTKIIPAPPALDSLAGMADLMVVRQAQAWRTEEQVAWANLVDRDVAFNNASVLGAWFTAERLPKTAEFFKRLDADVRAMDGAAKKPFLRPRPMTVDSAIKPCVRLPTSTGYPSGSAVQEYLWAALLAEAVPAKSEALIERARRAAWGRVLGGVHFPTDIEAGRVVAEAALADARKDEVFSAVWAAARAEIAAAEAAKP